MYKLIKRKKSESNLAQQINVQLQFQRVKDSESIVMYKRLFCTIQLKKKKKKEKKERKKKEKQTATVFKK